MQSSLPAAPPERTLLAVRLDRLIVPYAVVPLAVAFAAIDALAFGGEARRAMPRHPDELLYFSVFFNLPHIVASHLLFIDPDHARAYGKRWLVAVGVLAPATFALVLLGPAWVANVCFVATYYHVLTQQLGLTGAQLGTGDRALSWWKWSSMLVGFACFYWVAPEGSPGGWVRGPLGFAATLALIPWTLLAARLSRRATTARARAYLWANHAMLLAMVGTAIAGYPLLCVLMPRVVHDLTAFYVYGVHDINRNAGQPRNLLHRLLEPASLPSWFINPAAALLIAFWVQRVAGETLSGHLVYWLSVLHYYFEGVVWKGGSPLRAWAPFR